MTPKEQWAAARILYESRKREAWRAAAEAIIAREPWQAHAQHPLVCEDHLLALAQAKALLKHYDLTTKAILKEGGE